MRLEGTLDAFSLPDIFQLLSYTKKTGTLHLRRGADDHGVVHLREGLVSGARSDVRRQALARRLVGSGLVDDEALSAAVDRAQAESCGLARALADSELVPADDLRTLSVEQATDAVFDLMRWPNGEFAFVVDEGNPDDVGATQAVEEVVAEARRRLEAWESSSAPERSAVVAIAAAPGADPVLSRDEWALLSLVDGRRTVAELVSLAGSGEFTVVSALSGLVERGLLTLDAPAAQVSLRQQLIAQLEGAPAAPVQADVSAEPQVSDEPTAPVPSPPVPPSFASREPEPAPPRAPVIPERPEPFTPARQPEHAEPEPAYARAAASSTAQRVAAGISAASSSVGEVHGAVAMQPAPQDQPSLATAIERDPSVNKSLLLRLIAGVRGL